MHSIQDNNADVQLQNNDAQRRIQSGTIVHI